MFNNSGARAHVRCKTGLHVHGGGGVGAVDHASCQPDLKVVASGASPPLEPPVEKARTVTHIERSRRPPAECVVAGQGCSMAQNSAYLVPLALFFFGIVAIMLLTIRTEETLGVPDFMVSDATLFGYFWSGYVSAIVLRGHMPEPRT